MASSPSSIIRLVPVIAHAIAVFGDEQKASHWLSTPLPFFNDRAPQDLLETDEGIRLVEQTLIRIENNIPS
jgi:putative toxin-antitoxin system antitoxin component (TIGR02293 family)